MTEELAYSALIAFTVTIGSVVLLRRYAGALGLVAHPGGHRIHAEKTPLVGGLAILVGITVACVNLGIATRSPVAVWLAGGWFLALVGMIDDWRELPTLVRFAAQAIAAYAMVEVGSVWLVDLGRLFSDDVLFLGRWAVALSVFAAVGVINAVNMSDGMDGLAATLVLVALACLLHFASKAGNGYAISLLVISAVTVFGFWLFNARLIRRRPATVFMGDSGSTLLGWILAWFLISMSQGPERAFLPVTALWLVALPLFDAVGVLLRRAIRGVSPFAADRRHYHHYLLAAGLSVNQVLAVVSITALVFASVGIVGEYIGVKERYLFYGFLAVFVIYVLVMEFLDRMTTLSERTETVEAQPT